MVGDDVMDGDEVYCDGVNVASQIELLAEAGGICLTEEVSPYPDQVNIKEFVRIANNIFCDCDSICERWIIEDFLHPVPYARKRIGLNLTDNNY